MNKAIQAAAIEDLEPNDLARLTVEFLHRIILHYGLWFTEIRHQMGMEGAMEALADASQKSIGIQLQRLAKTLDFGLKDGLPAALADLPRASLLGLLDAISANWLANDGIWFQAVEFKNGMNDAKRCNDSCWAQFSPLEAWSIRRFLSLPENPGLAGLEQALNFRLYARVNIQSFEKDPDGSLIFRMNQCRVQAARKRKGLDDYPCKSGGLVEYTSFARAIDRRIRTECIGCPPDAHPEDWYCAWRFSVADNA